MASVSFEVHLKVGWKIEFCFILHCNFPGEDLGDDADHCEQWTGRTDLLKGNLFLYLLVSSYNIFFYFCIYINNRRRTHIYEVMAQPGEWSVAFVCDKK